MAPYYPKSGSVISLLPLPSSLSDLRTSCLRVALPTSSRFWFLKGCLEPQLSKIWSFRVEFCGHGLVRRREEEEEEEEEEEHDDDEFE